MSEYLKPFASAPSDMAYEPAPSRPPTSAPASRRPATSARRSAMATTDQFGAGVLDASATENRPCSIDDRADATVPGQRIW